MSATTRLDQAAAILDGSIPVPADQRVVASAHLARSGFEIAVAELLAEHGLDLRRAWMASRLTVLNALVAPELAATARLAWTGLSRACHRHAFELPPGEGEVRALISSVRRLAEGG